MALYGKFVIDNKDYSILKFPEIGAFLAFSGNGKWEMGNTEIEVAVGWSLMRGHCLQVYIIL